MMKVAAEHTIITKRPAQEIFYASSNMGWSAILHKNRTFQQVFISQAGDDAILLHIGVPLTRHGSSYKTRISHLLEEKRPDNGRCGKSNPYRDFLVVQWSFHDSSRIFSSPNSAVVGVDRPSEREMSFVGPQQVTQPTVIFRHLLKRPHRTCPPIHGLAR
ncbi:hypothetical protein TNCV_142481 [Trichonephila clavipes]|nr:hypothetical protein TNCV_142481 [Trichonephila clavipes]